MSEQPIQEKSGTGKYQFSSFPLYEHKTPEFREKQGYRYYQYGDDNAYPDYLVYLYNRSSVHNAIIDGKVRFILGNGWQTQDAQLQKFITSPNKTDSMDELSQKILLDRRIFGGYALKIVWFGKKILSLQHIPFQKIRVSVPSEEYPNLVYFHSNEWTRLDNTKARFKANQKMPDDVRPFNPFNPQNPVGEQLLYVVDYRPQTNIYPIPEYHPCNAAIETDIEIDNFHLNNIKSGFSAGKMVIFKNGKPDPDEQAKLEKRLKGKVAGTDNGGEIVVAFTEPGGDAPEILDLRSNDLDKQYAQLAEDTRATIFLGHTIDPQLLGLETPGKLSSTRQELDTKWDFLNMHYVEPKRKQFENEINWVLNMGGYSGKMELTPLSRLGIDFSEATILKYIPEPIITQMIADRLGVKIDTPPTTPQNVQMEKDGIKNIDEILLGKFESTGISIDGLEFADDEDKRLLLDYIKKLKKGEKLNVQKASKELKIDVKSVLETLIEANQVAAKIIDETNIEIEKVAPEEPPAPKGYEIVTLYEYAWVDPSQAKDVANSRDFCQRLLKMNKLWSREEIDGMSNGMKDFTADVWKSRGGWMTVPNTDGLLHQPSCRHYFRARFVKKPIY